MLRRIRNAWIPAAFAFVALASAAFAQVHPHGPNPPVLHPPVALPTMSARPIAFPSVPIVRVTLPPIQRPRPYIGAVRAGTKVPLFRLPIRPLKTVMNTATPKKTAHGRHFRPFAATGATIDLTPDATTCTNAGTVGALYNIGCKLTWQGTTLNDWSGSDQYQDYVVMPNATTATATGAAYTGNTDPGESTTLSLAGTYMFGVYDVTQQVWTAVVYANAGTTFTIQVFQDAFHTQQAYQFDVNSSTAAYIYLTNVPQGDTYVVYVMATSVNAYCAFMSPGSTPPVPSPSPRPTGSPNTLLCNPANSAGIQVAGTSLAVTWPLTTAIPGGTYSIVVFDKSINQALGQVQVSLTGASGTVVHTEPNGLTANPSPNPQPAPTPATIFAWDASTDQSDSGITGTVLAQAAGTYTWSISDPDGQTVGTSSETLGATGSASATMNFSSLSPAISSPGQYPNGIWTMQFYQPSTKSLLASQSFQMVGYNSQTVYIQAGVSENEINFPKNNNATVIADLKITNNSDVSFPGAGDNFSQIIYSTGPDFLANDSNGNGVEVALNGNTQVSCYTPGCTAVVADSAGNSWNVTDSCSRNNANPDRTSECFILFTPVSTSTTLAPGAYIDLPSLTWVYYGHTTGGNCYFTPCEALTSELPMHGLTWSSTTSTTAWSPTYFDVVAGAGTGAGMAALAIAGSQNSGGGSRNVVGTPGTVPFVGTHFYQSEFSQADYQNPTPYSIISSRQAVIALTVKNTGSFSFENSVNGGNSDIALALPTYFPPSAITVDSNSSGTWSIQSCNNGIGFNFSAQFICFGGGSIGTGATATIYLDVPMPLSSFIYQDAQVDAYSSAQLQWYSMKPNGTTATTPDGGTTVDSMAIGAYSLNGTLMSAYFQPASIGTGQTLTPLGIVVKNASKASDPNPDSLDAVVIEQTSNKNWTVNGTPTLTPGSWIYLGSFNPSGNIMDYWFGLCTAQFVKADGPPGSLGISVPLSASYPALPSCGSATEANSLQPGSAGLSVNMNLNNFNGSGTIPFNMYAHGADGGGWTQAKSFNLTATTEAASVGFTSVNATPVPANSVPTIGNSPNTFVYSVKNTSATANIGTIVITIPGTDINGANAYDGTNTWTLTAPISSTIVLSGTVGTCAVDTNPADTFSASNSGANGQITIKSCALAPGNTLNVQFQSSSPQVQSDSYLFPATVDGTAAGLSWLGSDEVTIDFTIGLAVVVDPSNPGSGGSTPVVSCSQCAFSGTTIDFGSIGNNASVTGGDVVRASVLYTGATSSGHSWQLSVQTNLNPACAGGSCGGVLNELLADDDSANSTTGAGITFNQTVLAAIPTSSGLLFATGPETYRSTPYEIIQNYKVQVGTESPTGNISTITYTLVAN